MSRINFLRTYLEETFSGDPLHQNLACVGLVVVYLLVVMELAKIMRVYFGWIEASRKVVHLAAASWICFWPLFADESSSSLSSSSHWSWRLNVLVPGAMAIKIFYKGAISRDPEDEDVKNMTRKSDPSELLYGPLQFAILMVILGLTKFRTEEAAIIMACVGIGDGMGALIGITMGYHKYQLPVFGTQKSWEGSILGVFLGSMVGCYFYPYMLGFDILPLQTILCISALATVVEGSSIGSYDNVILPVAIHYSLGTVKQVTT